MTFYKTYLKLLVTIPFWLVSSISTPLNGQNNIDYISDWYYIFFSQNDLISISEQFHTNDNIKDKITLNSKFSINDFYREKNDKLSRKVNYWQQVNELKIPVVVMDQNISLNVYSQFVSKQIDYDINSLESFKITHNSKKYLISLSSAVWQNYISLLTGISIRIQNSNSKVNCNLGIQFSLNNENVISFIRYTDYFKWSYEIGFQEPAIKMTIPENTQMNELNIRLQLIPNLTFIGSMHNNYINQNQYIASNKITYLPAGFWYNRKMNFNYILCKSWEIEFKYNSHQSDISGHFYKLKQSFGKFTKSDDFGELFCPGISYIFNQHTWRFNFTWGKGYLANRGHIETWPFTSTWIDLLGLRYNYNSRIEYNFNRYILSYKFKKLDWIFTLHSSYEILAPFGDTRTWEPEFLVFGIKNLKTYNFIYANQKGMYFMLDILKTFSDSINMQYQFSQYIPIKSVKDKKISNGNTTDLGKNRSIYGGGKHQIYLSFLL